jgi:formate hydrogenlyase subunit 3/multisubunit Na+/H+ antiporter MnhD subunit
MSALSAFLPGLPTSVLTTMVALFLMGFIVKLAIFPFHTWLPDAYTSVVMPLTLVLVGVMTNIGIYGMARFITFFPANAIEPISKTLLIAAVVTMFYAGFMALVEKNIKRILAYSSISQMGYVLFGFATLLPLGISGSILNLFNQAATKLALFMCVGTVAHYAGTYNIDELGGWGKRLPYIAMFATAAMLSLIGAPPVLGFWPEVLTFSAGFGAGKYTIAILAIVASAISAAYGLRLIRLTFFGALKQGVSDETVRPQWNVILAILLCFLILIVLGVFPGLIYDFVRQSIAQIGIKIGG